MNRGEVMFRALSYFHDLENTDGRADAYEGTRRIQPLGGLEINNITSEAHSVCASVRVQDCILRR